MKLHVNGALKDGGRGLTGGQRGRRLSDLLVAAEMALALMVLTGAGLMMRSFRSAPGISERFSARHIIQAIRPEKSIPKTLATPRRRPITATFPSSWKTNGFLSPP